MILADGVLSAAMAEIRERSKKAIYQRDFPAWQYDILGERTYAKMAEIGQEVLLGRKPRSLIKSANGTAKTFQAARWGMWWCTAFPPEESLAILTAPTLRQVELGTLSYMKERYGYVKQQALNKGVPMPWPGWLDEQSNWKYRTLGGNQYLAVGRVPGPQDAVSTFPGLRKPGGRNLIELDEAGGVSEAIFTAIEALMTAGEARMIGIGNPDRRGTPFHSAFTDERLAAQYNLHTISAYDLPTLTGEVVYPEDSEKEKFMRRGLTSAAWVAHKELVWQSGGETYHDPDLDLERRANGRPDGRFKAKVLGQFPDEDDRTFFPEGPINAAREREIVVAATAPIVLGVDVATTGTDETVVMVNQGGRVRVFPGRVAYKDELEEKITLGTWDKADELDNARRINAIARHLGATEVRIDGTGGSSGAGIATMLERLDEFKPRPYVVIRINHGERSTDRNRWANYRAQIHDALREALAEGRIDIDYDDKVLRDQLLTVTYDTTPRGAIQITKKKDMRSEMHGSPDRLDALIYAVLNTAPLTGGALAGVKPGDAFVFDPSEWSRYGAEDAGFYPI